MSLPIAGTGRRRVRCALCNKPQGGVSANSRELEHLYASEGRKGRLVRRLARRREERRWVREARQELGG